MTTTGSIHARRCAASWTRSTTSRPTAKRRSRDLRRHGRRPRRCTRASSRRSTRTKCGVRRGGGGPPGELPANRGRSARGVTSSARLLPQWRFCSRSTPAGHRPRARGLDSGRGTAGAGEGWGGCGVRRRAVQLARVSYGDLGPASSATIKSLLLRELPHRHVGHRPRERIGDQYPRGQPRELLLDLRASHRIVWLRASLAARPVAARRPRPTRRRGPGASSRRAPARTARPTAPHPSSRKLRRFPRGCRANLEPDLERQLPELPFLFSMRWPRKVFHLDQVQLLLVEHADEIDGLGPPRCASCRSRR